MLQFFHNFPTGRPLSQKTWMTFLHLSQRIPVPAQDRRQELHMTDLLRLLCSQIRSLPPFQGNHPTPLPYLTFYCFTGRTIDMPQTQGLYLL